MSIAEIQAEAVYLMLRLQYLNSVSAYPSVGSDIVKTQERLNGLYLQLAALRGE